MKAEELFDKAPALSCACMACTRDKIRTSLGAPTHLPITQRRSISIMRNCRLCQVATLRRPVNVDHSLICGQRSQMNSRSVAGLSRSSLTFHPVDGRTFRCGYCFYREIRENGQK
jgi:hypothetical protein